MLGTLLVQLAVIASRAELESMLCCRVVKFLDALAGVVPYSPFIDLGNDNQQINGTGTVYFSSNLRMARNCTVDHPQQNRKTIDLPVLEDIIIFLNNGKWIAVNDCEMKVSIDVRKDGDNVTLKTCLLELSKFGTVTVNDSPEANPSELKVLKNSLQKTVASLCDKYLSYSFTSSTAAIDQKMAYSLLQQVFKVFLTVM